ncbi:purine-nucleoside phosphorylase [Treponema sp.]|uniref:purine-nucleoside phosphorylase n=1 Tax=Treponema sp. TaxID=166 RepID=UPI00298E0354|nr:purine-nucleoside phosphorylase [Treponema sp.]MCR5613553.1 purine-nucleoside phosphorylase [Treponema sp.]
MSTHINAPDGAIAPSVLLPGDPLRAKFIAENFLENPKCYNEVRGMYGFTGTYKGKPVSVQGTGMGQPSLSIYVSELFNFYGVQNAIRVGTCGAIQEDVKVRDTILVNAACSDSSLLNQRFGQLHFAPSADFDLLMKAYEAAKAKGIPFHVGKCASSDLFYDDNANWKIWQKWGVLGVEMEAAELFTLAAKFKRRALAILTVSDHIITGEATTAEERQKTFTNMIQIALDAAVSV